MSGRPIARLNATDVNVFFDPSSTAKPDNDKAVYQNARDTDAGCFDVHEHDVLLQQSHQPLGMRQMAVFSSLRYKPKSDSENDKNPNNDDRLAFYIQYYKFAGLAVTPYRVNLGAEGFQQSQGFVATFTGLNVVRVASDVICGDILVAVPPLKDHECCIRDLIGKHTSPTMLVESVRSLKGKHKVSTGILAALKGFVVGKCVGGARKGQMATVVMGPYNFDLMM